MWSYARGCVKLADALEYKKQINKPSGKLSRWAEEEKINISE